MTLSTSIVIMSVTLALLQYFENLYQNRVTQARQGLRDEFAEHVFTEHVFADLKAMTRDYPNSTATKIEKRYDELVIFNVKSANLLLNTLFVVFALVVLLHAAHTYASLDDLAKLTQDTIVKVISYVQIGLDAGLTVIVVFVGARLYRTNRAVARYQRQVDEAIESAKTAVDFAKSVVNIGNSAAADRVTGDSAAEAEQSEPR